MSVSSDYYDLDQDNTLGGDNPSILKIPSQKAIKEALNTKQDTLVSGTNIKTINNTSLLGSGNIDIQSGSTTDVQINGTSITSNNVANIVTNTAYNSSSNKIATMNDVPTIATSVSSSSTNAETVGAKLFYDTCGDIETLINAL